MVRSRFLRNSSLPPTSNYGRDTRAGSAAPSRSFRAGSTVPSRDYRSGSMAPSRDYRSGSMAPSRDYRASSAAPYRASSIASVRTSSLAPYRASSIAPVRASSLAPRSSATYRSSSVTPYSRSYETMRSSYSTPYRASSITPSYRATSVGPVSSTSFRSASINAPRAPITTSYKVDTSIPTRQFGTRLGYSKVETNVKPAIYDEYYGMTYIPSSGRDSWSAYRISDEQLDDNDDLVYQSAKRDHDVMKKVNKEISQLNKMPVYRRVPAQMPVTYVTYTVPTEETQHVTSYTSRRTRNETDDIIQPQRKVMIGDAMPSKRNDLQSLKERLGKAREMSSVASSKYSTADSELNRINAEVQAIKNARAAREQSLIREEGQPAHYGYGLVNKMMHEHQGTSDLRKRIRSTVRRTKERVQVY